jgi:hypothetical protein
MRDLTESEVSFSVHVELDEFSEIEGSFATGDAEADAAQVAEIQERVRGGDVWAWAFVTVVAEYTTAGGTRFTGSDGLGGCCYKDEADFCQEGGYFEDMKAEALYNLNQEIRERMERARKLDAEMAVILSGGDPDCPHTRLHWEETNITTAERGGDGTIRIDLAGTEPVSGRLVCAQCTGQIPHDPQALDFG